MTTTAHASAMRDPTAILAGVPSYQHQREMRTGRAGPWGTCAPLLVADYQPQDWMASRHAGFTSTDVTSLLTGAGLGRRPFYHSHWSRLSSLAATNCGVSCHPPALPRINSVRVVACKRLPAKACQHEPLVNRTSPAGRIHRASLSYPAAFAGSQTSEALNGRVPNSSGAIQRSEGELPNVCC